MNKIESSNNVIYIGDLPFDITDDELNELFSPYGTILLLKINRLPEESSIKKRPYAYLTYESEGECTNAINAMNLSSYKDVELRVMNYNKSIFKNKVPTVWIKNIPDFCTTKMLQEAFSVFGKVISCKVAKFSDGKNKGYGFVTFSKKIEAKKAIAIGKTLQMDDQKLQVELFNPRSDIFSKDQKIGSLYFKNFNIELSEEEIKIIFEKIGKIISFSLAKNENGELRGFGFVSYESEEDNKKVLDLNGQDILKDGRKIYITRALSKEKRHEEVLRKFKMLNLPDEKIKRNLYITNIGGDVSEEELKELFSKYGNIQSLRMGADSTIENMKWAYMLFDTPEAAAGAINNLNRFEFKDGILAVTYFRGRRERFSEKIVTEINEQLPIGEINEKMSKDIFDLVRTVAGQVKKEIKEARINLELYEKIIPERLLQKSPEEVNEMISMGDVLIRNVKEILEEIKNNKN